MAAPAENHLRELSNLGGSFFGWSHWREVSYTTKGGHTYTVHVDTSVKVTLSNGRTVHPIHMQKSPCIETGFISTLCLLVSPFYIVAVLIYHTLRFAMIPLALLFSAVSAAIKAKSGERLTAIWLEIKQIPGEMWVSLRVVITTPILGVGWALSHLYILINPSLYIWGDSVNGRKLSGAIEGLWNRSIPLDECTWSVRGQMAQYTPRLGAEPMYMAGCYQVAGSYDVDSGQIFMRGDEGLLEYWEKEQRPWLPCCMTGAVTEAL